jgi:hypothetical protein
MCATASTTCFLTFFHYMLFNLLFLCFCHILFQIRVLVAVGAASAAIPYALSFNWSTRTLSGTRVRACSLAT